MPVQNFSSPQAICRDGQKTTSPDRQINNNPTQIDVQLTSTEWATKTGALYWGLERSLDGSFWEEWIVQPSRSDTPMPFGTTGKNGLPPRISISGGAMAGLVGARVRLFADVQAGSQDIRLGVDVTVTN
jgi:hypothetical protein